MTQTHSAMFSHAGTFSFLFLLSILHPAGLYTDANFPIAPFVLLTLIVIYLKKIKTNTSIIEVFNTHKVLIFTSTAFFSLCSISLLINVERYPDIPTFLRWGVIFVIFPIAIPISLLLASLPNVKTNTFHSTSAPPPTLTSSNLLTTLISYSPAIIAITIPISAIWQKLHFASYIVLAKAFIASAAIEPLNIRGLLAISTDLGAITGIFVVTSALLLIYTTNRSKALTNLLLFIFVLNGIAGILSGARVFLLMLLVGISTLIIQLFFTRKSLLLGLSILGISAISLLLQFIPIHTASKLAQIFPAILYLKLGIPIPSESFIPNTSSSAFGDRESIWSRAIEQIIENPLTGISNGAFRLLSEQEGETRINNTHNILLQAGIDAGVFGLLIIFSCMLYILFRYANKAILPLLTAILASLLVDNFTDHSFPWIIVACSTLCLAPLKQPTKRQLQDMFSVKTIYLATSVILAISVAHYSYQQRNFKQASLPEQMQKALLLHPQSSYQTAPAFITPTLAKQLKQSENSQKLVLPETIDLERICDYLYPGVSIFGYGEEVRGLISKNTLSSNKLIKDLHLLKSKTTNCISTLSGNFEFKHWIGNLNGYSKYHLLNSSLRLMFDGVSVWSPVINSKDKQSIFLTAKGIAVREENPQVLITIYNGKTALKLKEIKKVVESKPTKIEIDISTFKVHKIYIKCRLVNYKADYSIEQYQQVIFTSFILN